MIKILYYCDKDRGFGEERMKRQSNAMWIFVFTVVLTVWGQGCSGGTGERAAEEMSEPLIPKQILQSREGIPEYTLNAARSITVDGKGAVYIFDYDGYKIHKYDPQGEFLLEFGGTGEGPGEFTHLTAIRAEGDRILALDSVGLLFFSIDGRFLEKIEFPAEVTPDLPIVFKDGNSVGRLIVADELKMVLSFRTPQGEERDRLASYDIREFFPEIKPGDDFFLSNMHARSYRYDFDGQGDILWSATDDFTVYRYHDGVSRPLITAGYSPLLFPEDQRRGMLEMKSRIEPPLYAYVPDYYQMIHHLAVGPDGDLWIYLASRERTGFLRFSEQGKLKGFHPVEAEFDMMEAVVKIFDNRIYFLAPQRGAFQLYTAELPG